MVINIDDASDLPSIAEPWWQTFDGTVNFHPAMTTEDLEKPCRRWDKRDDLISITFARQGLRTLPDIGPGLKLGWLRFGAVAFLLLVVALAGAACGSDAASESSDTGDTAATGGTSGSSPASVLSPSEFVKGPDMKSRRERFTTVRFADGRLMSVGGRAIGLQAQSGNYNETAELFDPASTTWTFTGDMNEQRRSPGLMVLSDGRVLVVGGLSGQREPLASSEYWDEGTGVWVFGPEMNRPHDLMATAALPDGRFMMIGGTSKDDNGLLISLTAETEAYDPATETWTELAPMTEKRANHTATTLLDGRVLVVGGGKTDGPYLKVTELYDPATDSWTPGAPLTRGRAFHTATLLDDGRVLVVGGKGKVKIVEVYDPALDTWSPAGETTDPRSEHAANLLSDGTVLITGGTGYLVTSELFDPATNGWVPGEVLSTGRYRHSAFTLDDGRALIMGGTSKDGMLATTEIYGGE